MKKYKFTFLSIIFAVMAFVWIFIWTSAVSVTIENPAKQIPGILNILNQWPYLIFLVIGIFFGWKGTKCEKGSKFSILITLIEVILLLLSIMYYSWATAWVV